jgi:SP family sugar:H+ symporter-like MFS transporter
MLLVSAIPAAAWVVIVRTLPPSPKDTSVRRGKLSELRGSRLGLQPIVWIGLLLAAFQQLVGISVVKTYSNTIWQAVGFSTTSAFTISMITVGISILSTVVAIMIMDQIGRRTMLSAGAAVMALALAGLAFAFSTASGSGYALLLGRSAGLSALIAINLFAIAFGITWGPVMWVMLNELFETRLRTTAVAVCTAVNWLTNWFVVRTFPLVADIGLDVAYAIFAVFAALAFVFAWRILPETRGEDLSSGEDVPSGFNRISRRSA